MQKELLESAALEIPWTRRLFRIDRILLRRNLRIAWLFSAVVASGDIAATLPVIPPGMTTVGTRLFGLLHSGARYQEAALAFWYIIAIISAFLFVLLSEKHRPSNTRVV
jgi:iron(III) transport system permease protein